MARMVAAASRPQDLQSLSRPPLLRCEPSIPTELRLPMRTLPRSRPPRRLALTLAAMLTTASALAADHLDTPTVTSDPAADIGDLYAWTSADGRRLNLVLDIVGRRFSDQVQYVFHVDSGAAYGDTTSAATV